MESIQRTLALNYHVRRAQLHNREHLVVPVVMMVEGVHNGSQGPLYYPPDELSTLVEAWNGIPVTVGHPRDGHGNYVSANSPQIYNQIVGRVYNAAYDDATNRLCAEAWIDVGVLMDVDKDAVALLSQQRPMDVSVGVFTEQEEVEGDWNGEHYIAVARSFRPDHLALLPNAVGACSWDDGCGIRNEEGETISNPKEDKPMTRSKKNEEPKKELSVVNHLSRGPTENEMGFGEISRNIQSQLDRMDTGDRVHFLEELYDDYFVYRVANRGDNSNTYYRRDYTNAENAVQMGEQLVEVVKTVSYNPVGNEEDAPLETNEENSLNNVQQKSDVKMTRNKKSTPCAIGALIENEATRFTEEDREWLETLSEEQLDKLTPQEQEPREEPANNESNEVDAEAAVREVFNKYGKDANTFIDNLFPAEMRDQMKAGLKLYNDKRAQLVKGITDNSEFEEAELENWSMDKLEKLHNSVYVEPDYSAVTGNGEGGVTKAVSNEMRSMLRAPVEEKK